MTPSDLLPIIYILAGASAAFLLVGLGIWREIRKLRKDLQTNDEEER